MQLTDLKFLLSRKAIGPVAVLSMLSAGLFVFMELADEILEGEGLHYDETLFLALRSAADTNDPIGPPWLEEAAIELTALGGYPVIILMTLVVAGYLGVVAQRGAAIYVILSVAGGSLLSAVLKEFFNRPRPDFVEQLDAVHTASFPSGHAMVGTVTYLTLGALIIRFARTRGETIYVLCVVAFIAALVGLTRVYTGVHWPSDVLAGWALGISWAAFVWCVIGVIQYRTHIRSAGSMARGFFQSRYWREP